MNRYYSESASPAVREETGNPDLVEIFFYDAQNKRRWLCECDSADAPNIIAALELRETLLAIAYPQLDEDPAAQVVS